MGNVIKLGILVSIQKYYALAGLVCGAYIVPGASRPRLILLCPFRAFTAFVLV